ncbi:heme-binding-like protein, chloroplastic [Cinnamomum micranthum f. kanehirae]|uniref:Heme-binding-like protein, chloroplastic n=1 Tax=Cinnamomum micranthum f. kanehirae TaxID=337451 RepID=A0A3S3MH39_9MAGN|nr:heme-binding-like protein, chloroplastic [Cinnamomum micranthum f. kanehirae]
MLLTVPSPLSQPLCKIPFLPLPNNSYSTRNRPSTLITALLDAKITRISSSYSSSSSSSSVEDPKRMGRRKRNPDRNPSPLETRITLVLALASQAASLSQRVPDLETVKFKVLKREEEYEIRQVEPYFVAEMTMPGKSGFDFNGASQGFNVLAAYLFGKNTANETMEMTTSVYTRKTQSDGEKMEMTTPVITKQSGDLGNWQMSFVMPSKYGAKLPLPKDPSARITEVPGKIVAVAAFSGYVTDEEVKRRESKLRDALRRDTQFQLKESATVEVAQYNPPFTLPFTRRNEIALEVEQKNKQASE